MNANSTYKATSVLVTGASGFIGTHLCRHLNQQGAEITGTYLNHKPEGEHAKWICLDLTNQEAVSHLIHTIQPTHIFHLASHVQGQREIDTVLPTFENNLISTINILTAAQQAGCCKRLVMTNSQEEPDQSNAIAIPSSPYAASKFAASAYARMFHALYSLPIVIARVFMVYGPEQKDHRKLVPYTILKALNGQTPELSSGQRNIDWVYVSDVVNGLSQLGCKTGLEGETIDLGSGQFHTVKEVVEKTLKQIDPTIKGNFGAVADRAMEQERLADAQKTNHKLNWRAQVTLEDGLTKTIEWYRTHNTN